MKKSLSVLLLSGLFAGGVFAQVPAPMAPASKGAPVHTVPAGAVAKSNPSAPVLSASAAPAPGDVWVNGKVYHCAGSKYYGKTKHGSYMSEDAAKAAGAHADHGKACAAK